MRLQAWARHGWMQRLSGGIQYLLKFWTKLNDDWVFNLSGLLAYNFLMSLFPILLLLLAVLGFILGERAADVSAHIERMFSQTVPGGAEIFQAVSNQIINNAGLFFLIGLVMSTFAGSHLFIVIENCFGILFRVRGRDWAPQQLMAFGMLMLYLILVPIIALSSTIPSTIIALVNPPLADRGAPVLTVVLGVLVGSLAAFILFGAIYLVVPNRRIRLSQVFPGAVLATVLLVPYVGLFPLYVNLFLRPSNYGSVAGFAVVILVFFYYLGFILLLGAEVNSWVAGRRQIVGDLPTVLEATRTQTAKRGGTDSASQS